jgi:hypothetical protein
MIVLFWEWAANRIDDKIALIVQLIITTLPEAVRGELHKPSGSAVPCFCRLQLPEAKRSSSLNSALPVDLYIESANQCLKSNDEREYNTTCIYVNRLFQNIV